MKTAEVLVIGGGPAGLCAAISASEMGSKVILVERMQHLGGQLIKQTHMFFGSEKQFASTRGFDIAKILIKKLEETDNVEILKKSTVLGMFEDGVVTLDVQGEYIKVMPERIIVATGAAEKSLAFPNNDLPGIYGAGAVQTLMNTYGVKPGDDVLMIGAGNIGLIVSYQMLQAGVNVKAILDAGPNIGGYLVHASKIRRMGVPIYTNHTVKKASGVNKVEKATIIKLDEKWQQIEGTEKEFDVDVVCVSVGLSPLSELLFQAGCEMKMVPEFGGFVPVRKKNLQTSIDEIFIAGDVGGIEEASSAMVEGHIAGLAAVKSLNNFNGDELMGKKYIDLMDDYQNQLNNLRSGHTGEKIISGLAKVMI